MPDLIAALTIASPALPLGSALPRAASVALSGDVPVTTDFRVALDGLLIPGAAKNQDKRQAAADSGKDLPPAEAATEPPLIWLPDGFAALPLPDAVAPLDEALPEDAVPADKMSSSAPREIAAPMNEAVPPALPEVVAAMHERQPAALPEALAPVHEARSPAPSEVLALADEIPPPAPVEVAVALHEALLPAMPEVVAPVDEAPPPAPVLPSSAARPAVVSVQMSQALVSGQAARANIRSASLPGAPGMQNAAVSLPVIAAAQGSAVQVATPPQVDGPIIIEVGRAALTVPVADEQHVVSDAATARSRFDVAPGHATLPTPARVAIQAAPMASPVMTAGAAAQVFATALTRPAGERTPLDQGSEAAALVHGYMRTEQQTTVQAMSAASQAPLDLTKDDWTGTMIDRISAMRDSAEAAETRIKLAPENLGALEVAIRREGDRIHVHFTAENPAARQMISDAQVRLAELADARGVKLGQTSVDGGSEQGARRGWQHQSSQTPARNALAERHNALRADQRIA